MGTSDSRLVYSSEDERVRPPAVPARRKSGRTRIPVADGLPPDPGDGFVRLHRGKSARGGKPRTLVVGLPGSDSELNAILKRCKQQMGTGGTRQGRVLMIQGDHREKLQALLEAEGNTVKIAGS